MSVALYGRIVREQEQETAERGTLSAETNKLVTAIAALIPTEIIALHTMVVNKTTSTTGGVTTITDAGTLKMSLVALFVLSLVVYALAGGPFKGAGVIKALLPALAFLAWTGLIGTSALTPWITGWSPNLVVLGAGVIAVLVVTVSRRLTPPKPGKGTYRPERPTSASG